MNHLLNLLLTGIQMASAIATQWFLSRFEITVYHHDPDGTTATILTADGGTTPVWIDMRDFHRLLAIVTTHTGEFTKAEIVANTESDGSGTTVVIKDSGTVAADAVADTAFLECNAEEIAQLGSDNSVSLRYVSVRITMSTSTDEALVTVMKDNDLKKLDLTSATQIA